MTAIVVGRTSKENFMLVDAMVQIGETTSYKQCRLEDKMVDFSRAEQYLTLCGEQIVAIGASYLQSWSEMKKLNLDLIRTDHFNHILVTATKYRKYAIDIHNEKPPVQKQSTVYVATREIIKCYMVQCVNDEYVVTEEFLISENQVFLNYKGNVKLITLDPDQKNLVESAISELEAEHQFRKTIGITMSKNPLQYDFMGRFSSVVLPKDKVKEIERTYPFEQLTDMFLSQVAEWDYLTDANFIYSPNLRT